MSVFSGEEGRFVGEESLLACLHFSLNSVLLENFVIILFLPQIYVPTADQSQRLSQLLSQRVFPGSRELRLVLG